MPFDEKRSASRIQPYIAPCRVLDRSSRVTGLIVDLSAMGARITADGEPPPPDAAVSVQIRFAGDERGGHVAALAFPAQVRWAKRPESPASGVLFGLEFVGLTTDQRDVLKAIIGDLGRRLEEARNVRWEEPAT